MKKLLPVLMILGFTACDAPKRASGSSSASPVGVVTLNSYRLIDTVKLNENITYKFFTTSAEFHKFFHMTKATPGSVIIPDFSSQSVVAVILRPTTKVIDLTIDKAGISGNELQVHYTITDTSKFTTYQQPVTVAATVPKSLSVSKASFFCNGTKENTIVSQGY